MKLQSKLALLSLTLLFTGCSTNADSSSATATESTQEATSADNTLADNTTVVQELNLVLSDLATLDTNDARNSNEMQVLSHVQEGLFRVFTDEDGNDEMVLAGATSYTISDDGLVYTFTLRDHVWSDGVAVTAQHYVDSFIRLLTPENAFAYAFMAYEVENARAFYNGEVDASEVGVRALDDKTFEITLEAAIPYFEKKLINLCFYPVRLDVIEAAGESYLTDFTKHVFNGPFVIESRILQNEMVLAKNELYWDSDNVQLEKVTMTVIEEAATQSLLLDSGELDIVVATNDYYDRWNGKDLVKISLVKPSVTYLCFNQHTGGPSELMYNSKIRMALSLSIDRDEYNELINNGLYTPAYGLIPDTIMVDEDNYRELNPEVLQPILAQYDTDEKIKALFEEGLKEVFPDKELSDVTLEIFTSSSTSQTKFMLEYLQQNWQNKLGINITTTFYSDTSLFVDARTNNQYDLVVMGWNGDYNDPMTFFEIFNTDSGYAKFMGGYSNEEYDELFDSLAAETDYSVRTQTYIDMEYNLIAQNAGIAPISFTNSHYFTQEYVHNVHITSFGPVIEFSRAYIEE
ncbi:MAG: hypothetical protein ATN33_00505 [Epulopiscium sp. Nele67-Bin001]|nr:MAG: hypothetical protein ATN33_00505 [Epulopiscium sp. Nele67-Bin001]